MSVKTIKLPPALDRQAKKIAIREGVSMQHFVTRAVSAMIEADEAFRSSKRMSKPTAKRRLLELLDQAPDVPPVPGDELPPDLAARFKRIGSPQ